MEVLDYMAVHFFVSRDVSSGNWKLIRGTEN